MCIRDSIYAGVGAAAEMVRDHQLGTPVDFTPEAVARAMEDALAAARSEDRRTTSDRVSEWARQHASLAASGRAAAAWVLSGFERSAH